MFMVVEKSRIPAMTDERVLQQETRTHFVPFIFISFQFVCTVIAILLHYFYMCTFAWMFVEGLHIYRMLTELRNINHGHIRFYYAIGWGIPAIITGENTVGRW